MYCSHFEVLERERHERLTDKFAIHFFELKKLGNAKQHKPAEDWLKLIDAETEGDLMALQETTTIPEIQDAIVILRQMNADEQIRAEAWYREKRLHDEASALGSAIRKGEAKGQKRIVAAMRKLGYPEEQIAAIVKRAKNISVEPSDKPE